MSIEAHQITVGGLRVDVVRKAIKNLHLGVYPPYGRVRVAAPLAVSDDAVRLAVADESQVAAIDSHASGERAIENHHQTDQRAFSRTA